MGPSQHDLTWDLHLDPSQHELTWDLHFESIKARVDVESSHSLHHNEDLTWGLDVGLDVVFY